jgi:hypothetical protein
MLTNEKLREGLSGFNKCFDYYRNFWAIQVSMGLNFARTIHRPAPTWRPITSDICFDRFSAAFAFRLQRLEEHTVGYHDSRSYPRQSGPPRRATKIRRSTAIRLSTTNRSPATIRPSTALWQGSGVVSERPDWVCSNDSKGPRERRKRTKEDRDG